MVQFLIIDFPQNICGCDYRRRGKIRWTKHLWFQPYEVFCGNTFAMHWPPVFITYLLAKNSWENFRVTLKTVKTVEV